jgi:signal transduction histidine kinase
MKMLYHSLNLDFPAGDARTKDARIISEKMEHLNRIVEQILNFARSTEPQLRGVNINDLIDELGLLVRHKLQHQNIHWVRKLDPDLPTVMGEATQLEQAFLNLILNASEAMPKGGTLTIRTRALKGKQEAEVTQVEIDFVDTGEGMSAEQQVGAFSSVLSSTKEKGSGLGLAIVGRIIETHRGKIKLQSRAGKGTTVKVWLPVAQEENSKNQITSARE